MSSFAAEVRVPLALDHQHVLITNNQRMSASGRSGPMSSKGKSNGYWAKWTAPAEAVQRTSIDTARLSDRNPFQTILGAVTARQPVGSG
jgi:hypothetical protein